MSFEVAIVEHKSIMGTVEGLKLSDHETLFGVADVLLSSAVKLESLRRMTMISYARF